MSKTKPAKSLPVSRRLMEDLAKAEWLLEKQQLAEALEILLPLEKQYPNQPDVLGLLANAYYDLNDARHYEHALRRLAKLSPRDADFALGMAGAMMVNLRPTLAARAFEDFLRRWPDDPRAEEIQKQMVLLYQAIDDQVIQTGLPKEQALDLLVQHENLRYNLDNGMFELGRLAAEKLLKRYPGFIPAMNNLGQIYAVLGSLEKAIDLARQVLEKDPYNLHARANLARMLFLTGHADEARLEAQQLKNASPDASDRYAKLAETYSILGDDQAVLDLYEQAKRAKELSPPVVDAFFYHLLGVAALRQGREREARQFWKEGLKINANFDWTLQNLDDLKKAPAERNGPWAFPFEEWMLGRTIRDLTVMMSKVTAAGDTKKIQAVVRQFLDSYPEIVFLTPHLLERGDEAARMFMLRLAAISGAPEIVEPVKDFIFGRKGSSDLRMRGARFLSEAGLLQSGPIKMWYGDEQRDIMLLSMDITSEPELGRLTKAAQALADQAYMAVDQGDAKRAQTLLEKAIAIQPDDPSLHNNLAGAVGMQGDPERANEMIREIHRRYPDYFFGITGAAQLATKQGDYEQAHELLNALLQRKKLHISEFFALAVAQIDVWLAEKNKDAARLWLDMMEKIDPEHSAVEYYRRLLGPGKKEKL